MNLQIHLPDELEAILREQSTREGIPIESFVVQAVTERLAASVGEVSTVGASDFSHWLHKWAHRFPKPDRPIDDSRESIYLGRGE